MGGMLADSVLGTFYRWWLCSATFALLRRVYGWFRNAWLHSLIHRMLDHPSRIQAAYEGSLFGRIVRGVLGGLSRLFAAILHWLGRVNAGGWNYRFWRKYGKSSVFLKYEVLFAAFLAVMFLCPHDAWSNTYALIAAVGLLLLYLCVCGTRGRRPLDLTALGFPFFLFAAACGLSLAFTYAFGDSVRVLLFFLTAFLLCYLGAAAARDRKSLMTVLGFLYLAVLLTACYAVVQRIVGVKVSSSLTDLDLNRGVPGRVYATLDNPNNYAEFLALMTPLAAAFAINVKAKWKNIPLSLPLCLGLALPFLALVMTYSRSCWISIALAALVFLYFADKKLIPALFLLAVVAFPFLPDSVMTRLSTLGNSHDSSINYRIHLWRGVVMLLKDHGGAGIGLGPDSFAEVYPLYARKIARVGAPHSHMVWMELLVETGVFGFVSFLWFFLRTVKNGGVALAKASRGPARLALCGCVSALVGITFACSVEYVWYYPRVLFAFFLVCGFAIGLADPDGNGYNAPLYEKRNGRV